MSLQPDAGGQLVPDSSPPVDSGARPKRLARRIGTLVLGVFFSVMCFVYIGQKVDLAELRAEVQGLRPIFLMPAGICVAFSIAIRGYRWGLMLPRDYVPKPSRAVFPASIGLAINGLLPGKAGELSRIVYSRFVFKLPLVSATASVFAERLADMAALCVILAVAVVLKGAAMDSPQLSALAWAILGALLAASVVLGGLVFRERFRAGAPALREVASRVEEGERAGLAQLLLLALRPMQSAGTALAVVFASLAGWGFLVLANYTVAMGFASFSLSPLDIMALTSVSIIASALPSLPGAWGVFEGSIVSVAPLFGIAAGDARLISFGLTIHLVQYIVVLAMGGVSGICDSLLRR